MQNKLRYGCIGVGKIADKKHLSGYSKVGCVELAAVCDINVDAAAAIAGKYNIPGIYKDYAEMFRNEKLDIVSICTPNFLHSSIAIAALQAGINVHCEKPIALNAFESEQIVNAKNASGKKLMVALNNRFTDESYFIKNYADSGKFGDIYHVKCGWRRRNGIPGKGGWFTDKALSGGGPLIDLGVHYLDLVMYFMNYPQVTSVSGMTYSKFDKSDNRIRPGYPKSGKGKYNVEDLTVGFIRLENDATIDFEFSWASNIEEETQYYEILGTKGGASFRNGLLKIFTEENGAFISAIPQIVPAIEHKNEFEHFAYCIMHDKEPLAPPEQAVKIMEIVDAIYKSAEIKKEISQ